MVPQTIMLDVAARIEPEPTLGWVPTPVVGPYMVMICGEGGSESDEDSEETGEESVWDSKGYEIKSDGEGEYAQVETWG